MAVIQLVGDLRQRMGKEGSSKVRRDGFIPAILYGSKQKALPIKIDAKAFDKVVRQPGGVHSVIDFKLPGHPDTIALVREIQRDPVSREVIHLDFEVIEADKPVQVIVPLHLVGVPKGVKEGGVLEHITRDIDVKCLPRDIPGRWEVDVSQLAIGDHLSVKDLVLPNLEVLSDLNRTIATVVAPTIIVEAAPAAEAEAVEGAEPKPEGEEKTDEKD